jgi:O-succinylbenzoate synthase
MLEPAVGKGPSLALATKGNVGYPCDIFPSCRFFEADFSAPKIILSGKGKITAPTHSGAGLLPKMDFLKRHSVATATIEQSR